MTQTKPVPTHADRSTPEPARRRTVIDHVLERFAGIDLPAKDHFESYLRHKWRVNNKPKTIERSFTSIMLFLQFYGRSGKSDITQIVRSSLAFRRA